VLCSGKVYYDLFARRRELGLDDVVALVRLEQLAPFPERVLAEELARYPKGARVIWCQEEPANMGAWTFVQPRIEAVLQSVGMDHTRPVYAGRRPAASPATGLYQQHVKEQATLIEQAITGGDVEVAGTA
jgi:2-oxoglutarate dehydrogenase E1 component